MPTTEETILIDRDPQAVWDFMQDPSTETLWQTNTVEAVGDATRVTYHIESPTYGGSFGKLAEPLVNKLYSRDVKGDLENLKDIVESEGS